jgi:uncharacterized protein YaiI (UPF0178 family)
VRILVDADACPVKEEIYKVAERYSISVTVVSNQRMRVPARDGIELVVVDDGFDAADDWIVEQAGPGDVVISADIPLAARCLEKAAQVLGPKGRDFTEENIGDALASRELHSHLRDMGEMGGGPAPFQKRDRSRFLHRLDEMIQALRRESARREQEKP